MAARVSATSLSIPPLVTETLARWTASDLTRGASAIRSQEVVRLLQVVLTLTA